MKFSPASKFLCAAAAAASILTLTAPASQAAPAPQQAATSTPAATTPLRSISPDDLMARAIAQRAAKDPVFRAELAARIAWEVRNNPHGALANGIRAQLRAGVPVPTWNAIKARYRYASYNQYLTFVHYWKSGFMYPELAFSAG